MPGLVKTEAKHELDDMFGNEIDDKALARAAARYDAVDYDDTSNPTLTLLYYRSLFPFKQLFLWLNHDHTPTRQWTHREFAFTLQNDAYLRYNSFANGEDLKKEILRLNPSRFEIGPMYSGRPKDRKTLNKATFKPLTRELVFDVDMTDYDSIRTCCSDKKICKKCWAFIVIAARVVDAVLRDDFGFEHLLWVYSGRRGIHCWVSDKAAMELDDDQRRAIVNWIDVIKGGAKQDKKVNLSRPLHPSLSRSLGMLKDPFTRTILKEQDCLGTEERAEEMLKLLPEHGFASDLRQKWKRNGYSDSSTAKWHDILDARASFAAQGKEKEKEKMTAKAVAIVEDVVIQYTYPRIDTEVSKHLNHLLKSPFVIHPGTGRVCVPFETMAEIEAFDPEEVPTIGQLLRELEKNPQEGYKGTSLKKYVDIFDRHCDRLVKAHLARKKAHNAKTMDF